MLMEVYMDMYCNAHCNSFRKHAIQDIVLAKSSKHLINVVLPAPLAPTRPNVVFDATVNERDETASFSPYRLVSVSNCRAGACAFIERGAASRESSQLRAGRSNRLAFCARVKRQLHSVICSCPLECQR